MNGTGECVGMMRQTDGEMLNKLTKVSSKRPDYCMSTKSFIST